MNLYFVKNDIMNLLAERASLIEERRLAEGLDADVLSEKIIAIDDTLESLDYDVIELLSEVIKDIRNRKANIDAYKREEDNFKARRFNEEAVVDSEEAFVKMVMENNDIPRFDSPDNLFHPAIVKNGGKLPIEYNVKTPAELPEEFRTSKTVYKADDIAIREFLDAGGVSDLFQYGERGTHLRGVYS